MSKQISFMGKKLFIKQKEMFSSVLNLVIASNFLFNFFSSVLVYSGFFFFLVKDLHLNVRASLLQEFIWNFQLVHLSCDATHFLTSLTRNGKLF